LVLGLIALRQIGRTGERGRGLATASLVIAILKLVWIAIALSVMS
jgi:hypothetical protein